LEEAAAEIAGAAREAERRVRAEEEKKLERLYRQASAAQQAGEWAKAIGLFEEVLSLWPGYRDAKARLSAVQRALEEEKGRREREEKLVALYGQAEEALGARQWAKAAELLEEVLALDASYRDAASRLSTAREEMRRAEKEGRLASLYDQAQKALKDERWSTAVESLEKVIGLEAGYRDSQALLVQARERLAEKVQAEAVVLVEEEEVAPFWRRVPVWGWGAMGAAVLLIAAGAISLGGQGRESNPASAAMPGPTGMAMPIMTSVPTGVPTATLSPTDTPVTPTATPSPTDTPVTPTPTEIPTLASTLTPTPESVAVVQAEALNVRDGPGTEYDVVGQAKQGDELTIVARTEGSDWLQVRLTDGKEGWVSVQLVEAGGEAMGIPVAAVIPPTPTPVPPTATPTRTPQPTLTPTATIDVDPTVYDNFNNPANDGSFNQGQWRYWFAPPANSQVAQQDGILIVTKSAGSESPELAARKYHRVTLNNKTFFESKLMLSPDKHEGSARFKLHADLLGGFWFSECSIGRDGWASCYDRTWPQGEHGYQSESKSVGYGAWHTFRIEVDPAMMAFTYYIDGQIMGSHVPVDAEKLKKARFTLVTGVYGGEVTGYIDDVRVGPVQ
jgi:outer membrane protein assembly factor BamD (BamD/ComL family)